MKALKKLQDKKNRLTKQCFVVSSALVGMGLSTPFAASSSTIVKKLGTQVFDIFKYIGYILAIWGTGMLVMSFKNEDADSKSRAIMLLVSAIILYSLKSIFDGLGLTV